MTVAVVGWIFMRRHVVVREVGKLVGSALIVRVVPKVERDVSLTAASENTRHAMPILERRAPTDLVAQHVAPEHGIQPPITQVVCLAEEYAQARQTIDHGRRQRRESCSSNRSSCPTARRSRRRGRYDMLPGVPDIPWPADMRRICR